MLRGAERRHFRKRAGSTPQHLCTLYVPAHQQRIAIALNALLPKRAHRPSAVFSWQPQPNFGHSAIPEMRLKSRAFRADRLFPRPYPKAETS